MSAGQTIKGAVLFTIGSELTKKGIDVFKKKYQEQKQKRQSEREKREREEKELKDKLDND